MALPRARLRPLSAALLGLTLTAGIAGPLPAQAAAQGTTPVSRPGGGGHRRRTAARCKPAHPAKGLSMQKVIEYWGADARGINSEFADMQAAGATWARVSLPYGAAGAAGMARVVKRCARPPRAPRGGAGQARQPEGHRHGSQPRGVPLLGGRHRPAVQRRA